MRDLYADLHVPADANRGAIQASFRALAREFHPDFGGDARRMQTISEAWATLGRSDRRWAYDTGRAAQRATDEKAATATATRNRAEPPANPVPKPPERQPNTLDYGRYEGWTIEATANHDPDYLEWLRRSPGGRNWRARIDVALAARAARMFVAPASPKRRGRFGR
jgi:curved DNA-binding protein CbpA